MCDHGKGGTPLRFARPGVEGFRCAECGAEVITRLPAAAGAGKMRTQERERRAKPEDPGRTKRMVFF
jgi:hypothetical protein